MDVFFVTHFVDYTKYKRRSHVIGGQCQKEVGIDETDRPCPGGSMAEWQNGH
jgi:hypothetical protein